MKSFFVREISVSPDLIAQIIGVANEGADIFADTIATYEAYSEGESEASASALLHGSPDPKFTTSELFGDLSFLPRCIARILGGSIFSKAGNRDKTAGCHKLLTYLLLKKVKVNLPLLLYKTLWHGTHYGRSFYPHGTLVSSILAHHGLDLSTFPQIPHLDPFSQKNLSLMDFKAHDRPLTLDTPRPHRVTHVSSAAGPSVPHTSESVPVSSHVPTSVPSSDTPLAGASTTTPSSVSSSQYPSLESIIPLFTLAPGHRVSLRDSLPLLQSSLLGMLNDNIRSHNETRETILTALGLPLPPPRPLYTSPYDRTAASEPALPTSTTPPTPSGSTPQIYSSMDLSHALDAISLPSIDSEFASISELFSGLATPSSMLRGPSTSFAEPRPALSPTLAPIFTTSDVVTTSPVVATMALPETSELSTTLLLPLVLSAPSPSPPLIGDID